MHARTKHVVDCMCAPSSPRAVGSLFIELPVALFLVGLVLPTVVKRLTLHGTILFASLAQIMFCLTFALPPVHSHFGLTVVFLP